MDTVHATNRPERWAVGNETTPDRRTCLQGNVWPVLDPAINFTSPAAACLNGLVLKCSHLYHVTGSVRTICSSSLDPTINFHSAFFSSKFLLDNWSNFWLIFSFFCPVGITWLYLSFWSSFVRSRSFVVVIQVILAISVFDQIATYIYVWSFVGTLRPPQYVDATHDVHSMVSVRLPVCAGHTLKLCKNGWTDRDGAIGQIRVGPRNLAEKTTDGVQNFRSVSREGALCQPVVT